MSGPRLPITCGRYEALPGSRRCRHYAEGGVCALVDEFLCTEWLKANGRPSPPPLPPLAPSAPHASPALPAPGASPQEGHPASTKATMAPPPLAPVGPSAPLAPPRPLAPLPRKAPQAQVLLSVRDSDIASFKALGTEVQLVDEHLGEVWIVPAYTGQDRAELSVEHAALLAAICSAFPAASVTSFVRKPKAPESPR